MKKSTEQLQISGYYFNLPALPHSLSHPFDFVPEYAPEKFL